MSTRAASARRPSGSSADTSTDCTDKRRLCGSTGKAVSPLEVTISGPPRVKHGPREAATQDGETTPAIKIDGRIIADGNHRYIAGRILGQEPAIQQWLGGRPGSVVPWADLPINPEVW